MTLDTQKKGKTIRIFTYGKAMPAMLEKMIFFDFSVTKFKYSNIVENKNLRDGDGCQGYF